MPGTRRARLVVAGSHGSYSSRNKERRKAEALQHYHEQQVHATPTATASKDSGTETVRSRLQVLHQKITAWAACWGGVEEWESFIEMAVDVDTQTEIAKQRDLGEDFVVGIQGVWNGAALAPIEEVPHLWNFAFFLMRRVLGGMQYLPEDFSYLLTSE